MKNWKNYRNNELFFIEIFIKWFNRLRPQRHVSKSPKSVVGTTLFISTKAETPSTRHLWLHAYDYRCCCCCQTLLSNINTPTKTPFFCKLRTSSFLFFFCFFRFSPSSPQSLSSHREGILVFSSRHGRRSWRRHGRRPATPHVWRRVILFFPFCPSSFALFTISHFSSFVTVDFALFGWWVNAGISEGKWVSSFLAKVLVLLSFLCSVCLLGK